MAGSTPDWPSLLKLARSPNGAERCHAVVQAQSALERLLSTHGYRKEGETPFHAMATRAALEHGIELPGDLRDVIRLRNQVSHEGHVPGTLEAEDAVEVYQQSFDRLAAALSGPRRRNSTAQRGEERPRSRWEPVSAGNEEVDAPIPEPRGSRRKVVTPAPMRAGGWSAWTAGDNEEERTDEEETQSAQAMDRWEDRPEAGEPRDLEPDERLMLDLSGGEEADAPAEPGPLPPPARDIGRGPARGRLEVTSPDTPSRAAPPPPRLARTQPGAGPDVPARPPTSVKVPPLERSSSYNEASGGDESPATERRARSSRGSPSSTRRRDREDEWEEERRPEGSAILYFGYAALTWLSTVTLLIAHRVYTWAAPADAITGLGWIAAGILAGLPAALVSGIIVWPLLTLAGLLLAGFSTGGLVGAAAGGLIGGILGDTTTAWTGATVVGVALGALTSTVLISRHYLTLLLLRFK